MYRFCHFGDSYTNLAFFMGSCSIFFWVSSKILVFLDFCVLV